MTKKMRAGGICFMVKRETGLLVYFTHSQTREQARRLLIETCRKLDAKRAPTWRQLYRKGYRVVRVQYQEID